MVLYGVGFGSVSPDIPVGEVATIASQLIQPLRILFGQTDAQVTYSGLAPNLVGCYQFNIVVPEVANSDAVPLTFILSGRELAQKPFIAVRQ